MKTKKPNYKRRQRIAFNILSAIQLIGIILIVKDALPKESLGIFLIYVSSVLMRSLNEA